MLNFAVLFLVFAVPVPKLLAQAPNRGANDCSDPVYSTSLFCRQTNSDAQQQQTPADIEQRSVPGFDTESGQRLPQTGTQPYIDTAGSGQRQANTTLAETERPKPELPTDLQQLGKATSGEMLPIFGRDLFRRPPTTFAPADQIPALPDYVIGPGDQILLRIWGHDQLNSQLTVDSSGSIYIPQVGAVHVAGFRLSELQEQVRSQVAHTYKNFDLSVNLGHLRSIQVFVVGEAQRPGAYTVSSLSTVLNALFASGGPSTQGSMRDIQIRRQGNLLTSFDLYDLALRGDKSKDVQLQSGDVIFIPPVGPQVVFGGSIRHPAIYELKGETTLQNLLDLAGGFSATASRSQIELNRIEDNQVRRALNISLDAGGRGTTLRDGDVLYSEHISAGYQRSVTIRGNLANPGRFAWHPGMKLSEIIPDRMSLLTNQYWRERNLLGVPVPLFLPEPALRTLTLGSDPNRTSQLRDGSQPTQPSPTDTQADPQLYPPNGVIPPATDQRRSQTDVPRENLTNAPDTTLTRGALAEQQQSTANGNLDVRASTTKIKIPTAEIDWSYAVIERLDPDTLRNSLVPFNLGRLVQDHDPSQDLELHAGDVVTILSQEDIHVGQDEQTKYVRLEGELKSSGVYSVQPNETLADVVRRAGGVTSKAYLYGGSFTRESARIAQQQRLDEYINSLSIDLERSAATRAASSATNTLDPNALAQQRVLITQLKQLRATGRVVLEFQPGSSGLESIPNVPLENGDIFRVPANPGTVSVIGAVNGQNVFIYNPKRKVQDYLYLAGDPNRIADRKHAFIIRADGSILSRERTRGVLSNKFALSSIYPGDTIVIPEKLIKPSAVRQFEDYAQIFSSFALGAAAINVIR